MTRVPLPLPFVAARRRMMAHGAMIDYETPTVVPCTPKVLAPLLARIPRYGVHAPIRNDARLHVLAHSVLVAFFLEELFASPVFRDEAPSEEATRNVVKLYGATHDLGEIFGGDVVTMVPPEILVAFRAYQSRGRANLQGALGLPEPSLEVQAWVRIADLVVVLAEKVAMGICPSLHAAAELGEAVNGWTEKLATALAKVGIPYERWPQLAALSFLALGRLNGGMYRIPQTDRAQAAWLGVLRLPRHYLFSQDGVLVGSSQAPDVSPSKENGRWSAWLSGFTKDEPGTLHGLGDLVRRGSAQTWSHVPRAMEGTR